jgi:hypothetical protein
VYLFKSTNHGASWSAPALIGNTNAAHMLPAAVGGPRGGQLAIGFFRTVNGVTNPNATTAKWTYATAESTNTTAVHPTFTYQDVNPGFIYHNGQICNAGILCGAPGEPSDRSLLDFTSAALDVHGCPLFTFAGNPGGDQKGTSNYVTRQLAGCFAAGNATTPTTSTHKKHKKKHKNKHKKRRRPARRSPAFTG